ncbi:MAG TPA: TfoX/Sxy family protein [Longimicrobiaceae bacterium]
MAFSDPLAARLRSAIPPEMQAQERRMVGGLAFLVGGHMACGVVGERLMVRIPPADRERVLAEPHVRPMEFTGRPMRGFVLVDPAGIEGEPELSRWVRRGVRFASSLPPK